MRFAFLRSTFLALVLMASPLAWARDLISDRISRMTPIEKVEQLLVFGFAGRDYSSSLGPRQRKLRPGSFIVFGRNVRNPYELSAAIKQAQTEAIRTTGLPLLFMMDQEGGQVTRIKTKPTAPSALSMGKTKNQNLVYQIGLATGKMLNSIGINMNLAPVLDIADPRKRHFIGNRSFGSNPQAVANFGNAFSKGLTDAGVMPTAKHFPGHGGTRQDSHKVQAKKFDSLKALINKDLFPFAEYAKIDRQQAMMIAHVAYPALDPSGLPATFSKEIVTNLLRDRLGFNGLVITDDLEMNGAKGVGTVGRRAVKAIQAGCDLVMVAWSLKKQGQVKRALVEALKSGVLSEDRVNDSVRRVLVAKTKILRNQTRGLKPSIRDLPKHMTRLKELSHKVSKLNFDYDNQFVNMNEPEISAKARVYVYSADQDFFEGVRTVKGSQATYFSLRGHSAKQIGQRLSQSKEAIGIYYASGAITARALSKVNPAVRRRLYVINTTYPGLIKNPESFAKVINLNTKNPRSGLWIARYLFESPPEQRMPSNESARIKRKHTKLVNHGRQK